MKVLPMPVDFTKIRAIVYHMPDGEYFTIKVDGIEHCPDFNYGKFCDTSDIDGLLHFYPEGNA